MEDGWLGANPLAFEMFEGNKFEGETMLTVVEDFKKKFQLSDVVVVADAGLMSKQNIDQQVIAVNCIVNCFFIVTN